MYFNSFSISILSSITTLSTFIVSDEVSIFIVILLFYIIYISILSSNYFTTSNLNIITWVFISLFIFCLQVFTTSNLFYLYFFYESSLLPILFIIIKWGSYPDRSLSSFIMIAYTLFFGVPFMLLMLYLFNNLNSFNLSLITNSFISKSFLFTLFTFICFAVKLPIYGLHYWLPIAHVEAPTFGSVILARILLKLGGVGLIRLYSFIETNILIINLLSYFIFILVISSLICAFQSDFKRLVAYSSVAHIIVIPFLIIRDNLLSNTSIILIIFHHGLSSTLIFLSVGILYSIFNTRLLLLIRGIILISPLISFLLILSFFYTLSAPPFPSFIGEILFLFSSYSLFSYFYIFIIFILFLSLLYNINWLSNILFNSRNLNSYSSNFLTLTRLLPFITTFIFVMFSLSFNFFI